MREIAEFRDTILFSEKQASAMLEGLRGIRPHFFFQHSYSFMADLLRQEIATGAHTIVIKIGTRVLTQPDGSLDYNRIVRLGKELNAILDSGRRVVVVSSGAVGAGMDRLGWSRRPTDLPHLQAVAAIGQSALVEAYDKSLRVHGRHVAQVLLTAEDLNRRPSYLNARNTILTLLELGAVPIINENDTVSVDELRTTFGDNDRLAGIVTNLLRAPLLILLSDVPGLYDGPPAALNSRVIPLVTGVGTEVLELVHDRPNGMSKGGMASKLEAARLVTAAGENVIIASGRDHGVLGGILAGETVGTLVIAQGRSVTSRKRWIGFAAVPKGAIRLDHGASQAVRKGGRSLLPAGIVEVTGEFEKGDVVSIQDIQGADFARGLTNYGSSDIRRIKGLKTEQIFEALGYHPYDEVVHRDNMVVTN